MNCFYIITVIMSFFTPIDQGQPCNGWKKDHTEIRKDTLTCNPMVYYKSILPLEGFLQENGTMVDTITLDTICRND